MSDDRVDAPSGGGTAPRPGTVHPHLARERALKVLFQADVRDEDPRVALDRIETRSGALELLDELEPDEAQVAGDADLRRELARRRRLPLDEYTRTLVGGVATHRVAIDRVLEDVAEHWAVSRMPVVDRNLLRLAVYELAAQDTPAAVVIDEAVQLARGFAGDKARPFVNGVLETVRRRVVAGELVLADDPEPLAVTGPADQSGDADRPEQAARPPAQPRDEDPAAHDAWTAALDLLAADEEAAGADEVAGPGGPPTAPEHRAGADGDVTEPA